MEPRRNGVFDIQNGHVQAMMVYDCVMRSGCGGQEQEAQVRIELGYLRTRASRIAEYAPTRLSSPMKALVYSCFSTNLLQEMQRLPVSPVLQPLYCLRMHIASVEDLHCNQKNSLTEGGFDEISYVTRFTPATSFVILDEILLNTSGGNTYLYTMLSGPYVTHADKCGKKVLTNLPS